MKLLKKELLLLLLVSVVPFGLQAFLTPANYNYSYERILKNELWDSSRVMIAASFEDGDATRSRDSMQNKVCALRLYNPSESAISMLLGAPDGSPTHAFANSLLASLGSATDDGVRGHFLVDGEFDQTIVTLSARYKIPFTFMAGNVDFGIYMPIVDMSVSDVCWTDQTLDVLNADAIVRQNVTSKIDELVADLGCLKIRDWNETGIGDIAIIGRWYKDFAQDKDHIKNVRISVYGGLSIPTAENKDEDEALSFPLGNDGAWGLPLGISLDLDFSRYLRSGIEVNFLTLFDETRVRRLKTDEHQTDFLLLNTGKATKSFGPTWKFTFYAQAQGFVKGLTALCAYQFMKHDEDTLYAQDDCFDHDVVNSAQTLQEWDLHNLLFQINFDSAYISRLWFVKPHVSLFYKLPVSGKRAFHADTWGGQIGFSF